MKIEIITSVENGNLKRNRELIKNSLNSFEGKTIKITIEKLRNKRTNPQNAYYWGVIIPIFKNAIKDAWGEVWSAEETHETLKAKFNYIEKVNETTGEILKVVKSTTKNTSTEQEEYHNEIRKFTKDFFNIDIPLPNEQINLIL